MHGAHHVGQNSRRGSVRRHHGNHSAPRCLRTGGHPGARSGQETAIGITVEQQEAWRTYTNALLALVPERERMLALLGAADGKDDPKGPEAFGRAEAVADTLIAYTTKAQALKAAVANLRGQLSRQQLEAARIPRL